MDRGGGKVVASAHFLVVDHNWPGDDDERASDRGATADHVADDADLLALQGRVAQREPGWTHIEKLHVFDGADGFTKAQGE